MNKTAVIFCILAQRNVLLKGERVATRNNHETGCTFSSAIASSLAKEYITGALRAGSRI